MIRSNLWEFGFYWDNCHKKDRISSDGKPKFKLNRRYDADG
jgi:hypothetical protein